VIPASCRHLCAILVLLACLAAASGAQQSDAADPTYETLFYTANGLKLQAYLYIPQGKGPFPLIVYNHGSRPGDERTERPVQFIARLLVPAGYAVLVPERRGYGKSEGTTFSEEIGQDRGPTFVARLEAEAQDALAAADHVLAAKRPAVDATRVAMMGFSFGGLVTTFGASDPKFKAAVVQAPGALTWPRSPALRSALPEAARRIRIPTWCGVAENDASTESTKRVCGAVAANGVATQLKIYPPFTPPRPGLANAPGHTVFSAQGVTVWAQDVLAFLRQHVRG
jgi:dienelactone hydrolase